MDKWKVKILVQDLECHQPSRTLSLSFSRSNVYQIRVKQRTPSLVSRQTKRKAFLCPTSEFKWLSRMSYPKENEKLRWWCDWDWKEGQASLFTLARSVEEFGKVAAWKNGQWPALAHRLTRDNARCVMDLSFPLCKEWEAGREKRGKEGGNCWIYAKCAGYILHPRKAMLPRREEIPQIASGYVKALFRSRVIL